jgi:hypothetical protein
MANLLKISTALGWFLSLTAQSALADSILVGGIEDTAGMSGYEQTGDFNDLIFTMSGNVSVVSAGASFASLTPAMLSEAGPMYWDKRSLDGPRTNFGYCVTGIGGCGLNTEGLGALEYLADDRGSALLGVAFAATGSVSLSLIFELSSLRDMNTLGWYDPEHPEDLHPLIAGTDGSGFSITFNPSAVFALYTTNGIGQFYSSITSRNQNESVLQQHFAFVRSSSASGTVNDLPPGGGAATPEPGTALLTGAGLSLTLLRKRLGRS